jgi:MFS family permease
MSILTKFMTGFIIVWAKLSDIFKRKWTLLAALIVFTITSGICGAAQDMTTL